MSRSYKKHPSFSDYSKSWTRWAKRQASKKVRKSCTTPTNGAGYKKAFSSYDIRDYIFIDFNSEWGYKSKIK